MKNHPWRGVGALALGLLMLTRTEASGLAIKGVSPQLKQSIASLADNRPVILARAPFATYVNPNTAVTVMSFVFPPYSLESGDMLRASLFGNGNNNSAANQAITVTAQAVQGPTTFQLASTVVGGLAPVGPLTYFAWHADFLFSVGVPNVAGNYVPNINAKAVTTGSTYSSGLQPAAAINFTGNGQLLATDTTLAGAVITGGRILAGGGGSSIVGRVNPYIFDNSLPIEVDITVAMTGLPTTVFVNAGVLEGL